MENEILVSSLKAVDKASSKAKAYINEVVDANSFVETDVFLTASVLDDVTLALGEGVVTGYATIGGRPVHLFAQNAEVLKGSLSKAHAAKIYKSMHRAIEAGVPFVSIIDSCGARVGEGASIMEGYAQLIAGGAELGGQVPHIAIVKGVAVGMMATYVAGADFTFMSNEAVLSVNSPMYLMSDSKKFPVDYKKSLGFEAYKSNSDIAQFGYKTTTDLKKQLTALFDLILPNDEQESKDDANRIDNNLEKQKDAAKRIESICDKNSVMPYCAEYAKDVCCAIAKINGITVGVLATQGDYISEQGITKSIGFIEKMDNYDIPLVTLVDSLGVNSSMSDEFNGFADKTNRLFKTIINSTNPKIGVAFGNAVGFAYSCFMSKNVGFGYTLATAKSVISPIAAQTAVATLMVEQLKDAKNIEKAKVALETEYAKISANPLLAAKDGYVDNVVETKNLRPYIASALMMLLGL